MLSYHMCQVGECKTNFLNQFLMTHMMRHMCWQQLHFHRVLANEFRGMVSNYDGNVENNGLGEIGPLSTHKSNLQNTHRLISERVYWNRVRERNRFSILKKAEAEDLLCWTLKQRVYWFEDLKQSNIYKSKMESGNKFINVQIPLYMMLVKNLKVLGPVIK